MCVCDKTKLEYFVTNPKKKKCHCYLSDKRGGVAMALLTNATNFQIREFLLTGGRSNPQLSFPLCLILTTSNFSSYLKRLQIPP